MLHILYEALASPLGKVVITDDAEALRQRLYQVRSEAKDPELACLSFHLSPHDPIGELWIVKRGQKNQ